MLCLPHAAVVWTSIANLFLTTRHAALSWLSSRNFLILDGGSRPREDTEDDSDSWCIDFVIQPLQNSLFQGNGDRGYPLMFLQSFLADPIDAFHNGQHLPSQRLLRGIVFVTWHGSRVDPHTGCK